MPEIVGWFLATATVVLTVTYGYFWWTVIWATAHKHVNRSSVTNDDLVAARAEAMDAGHTAAFLIQVTTKGGALAVVERGIDEVLAGAEEFPVLREMVRVEVVTEDAAEAEAIRGRYAAASVPVSAFRLPADYRTPRGTLLKARALHYMVEVHRAAPEDCYVVHYDEESVFTPLNLARLVVQLLRHPVGISEGMISYGLDWNRATVLNKAMESNRPFGCHECYSVMTSPPPMHLHGSNLVIRQDLENELGWDIGTLEGTALVAEDLVFGLSAYARFGEGVFGWHRAEMIEQPPFTVRAAYRQRERWVFGALQALEHLQQRPEWAGLGRRVRWHIGGVVRGRVLTYALGFPVSLLALLLNLVGFIVLGIEVARGVAVPAPGVSVYGIVAACGLTLWLAGTQLGLFYNLRYSGATRWQRIRDHAVVLLVTPVAGLIDTAGPLVAGVKWITGHRSLAWTPTPKLAPAPRLLPKPDAVATPD